MAGTKCNTKYDPICLTIKREIISWKWERRGREKLMGNCVGSAGNLTYRDDNGAFINCQMILIYGWECNEMNTKIIVFCEKKKNYVQVEGVSVYALK